MPETPQRATLSVAIITFNEEENIGRTLASVKDIADEIIVVDSGSTDRTAEIAKQFGAKIFVEGWKGFAAQKNSALDKCTGDWVLSLDADEEVDAELSRSLKTHLFTAPLYEQLATANKEESRSIMEKIVELEKPEYVDAFGDYYDSLVEHAKKDVRTFYVSRKNLFLGRFIRFGGFYPDRKLRLIKRGAARFELRSVHEDLKSEGHSATLNGDLIHHQYPTLTSYIEHMNRYSSLGAEMVLEKRGRVVFSVINIVFRPIATFIYNYFLRLGFLDGKEGLLLHLYHSVYVSWKYAKAWELSRKTSSQ